MKLRNYYIQCSALILLLFNLSLTSEVKEAFIVNDTIISYKMATTYLNCASHNRFADETVSWIRLKDDQILSIGRFKFTNNPRIGIIHDKSQNIWRLQIRYTAFEDEGLYECQITTSNPEKVGLVFNLTVLPDESYYMNGRTQIQSSKYQQSQQNKRSPVHSSSRSELCQKIWLFDYLVSVLLLFYKLLI